MNWWQSLLISLSSSIVTAVITLIVPLVELKHAKEEREAQYETEKRQHISHMRLDMEFSIYKELSEKVVSVITYCLGYFFDDYFDFSLIGKKSSRDEDIKIHDNLVDLINEANKAINMYAAFIPTQWFEKFDQMKLLCSEQLDAYSKYVLDGDLGNKSVKTVKKECRKRYIKISDEFDKLVVELRKYISALGTNSSENNQ